MPTAAIVSALLILGGIWIVAAALSRWGRTGTPPRRVGALMLLGLGVLIAGGTTLSEGSIAGYVTAAVFALIGVLLLVLSAARGSERSLPKLKRHH